eukprot:403357563
MDSKRAEFISKISNQYKSKFKELDIKQINLVVERQLKDQAQITTNDFNIIERELRDQVQKLSQLTTGRAVTQVKAPLKSLNVTNLNDTSLETTYNQSSLPAININKNVVKSDQKRYQGIAITSSNRHRNDSVTDIKDQNLVDDRIKLAIQQVIKMNNNRISGSGQVKQDYYNTSYQLHKSNGTGQNSSNRGSIFNQPRQNKTQLENISMDYHQQSSTKQNQSVLNQRKNSEPDINMKNLNSYSKTDSSVKIKSIWDIVTMHQVQQHQHEQQQVRIKNKLNKDMLRRSLDEQERYREYQKKLELDQIEQDNKKLVEDMKEQKTLVIQQKLQKKNQMKMLHDHYTQNVSQKNQELKQSNLLQKQNESVLAMRKFQDYKSELRQKKQLRKDLHQGVQSFNLSHFDNTITNIKEKQQNEKELDKSTLSNYLKPFETAQQRYQEKLQKSVERQNQIQKITLSSPIKIHTLAHIERNSALEQIAEKNIQISKENLQRRENLRNIKHQRSVEQMKTQQTNQINIKNLLHKEDFMNDWQEGKKLIQLDKSIQKQQETQNKWNKVQMQKGVRGDLLSQMRAKKSQSKIEDIDQKEFILNKNIINQYYQGLV